MHRDTKVGLALGVLLVGVVGAFFFRHEGRSEVDVPSLANPGALDTAVAEKPVVPYLEGDSSPIESSPVAAEAGGEAPHWEPPRFLQATEDGGADISLEPLPPIDSSSGDFTTDDPGSVQSNDRPGRSGRATNISQASGARFHIVETGDTLSGIALEHLGSTAKFLDIYEANRDVLSSPDRLQLGQRLRIPDGSRPRSDRLASSTRTIPTRERTPAATPTPRVPAPRPITSDSAASRPAVARPAESPALDPQPVPNPDRETFDLPPMGEGTTVEPEAPPVRRFIPARRPPLARPLTNIVP